MLKNYFLNCIKILVCLYKIVRLIMCLLFIKSHLENNVCILLAKR